MAQPTIIPYFAAAPIDYDRSYMAQITRAFSLYAQQMQNPGATHVGNTLNLTSLVAVYANNARSYCWWFEHLNDVYKTANRVN
jgi:hypothetical protein